MSFVIRNISGGTIELDDLGITLSAGEDYNLAQESPNDINQSEDLRNRILASEVVVLEPRVVFGGSPHPALTQVQSLECVVICADSGFRIFGGDLNQLDDVNIGSPIGGSTILKYQGGNIWSDDLVNLPELGDVVIGPLAEGQVLAYVGSPVGWTNVDAASGVGGGVLGLGEWEYETNAGGVPDDARFRFNTSPTGSPLPSEIRIDYNNDDGDDLTNILNAIEVGRIYAQERDDSRRGFVADITGVTIGGSFVTYSIENFALLGSNLNDGNKYAFIVAGGSGVAPTDEQVKVSSNDTTAGFLNGKLVSGTGISLVENNDGANETLTITNTDPNVDQNLFETFTADVGSTTADSVTDTLTVAGGTGVSTAIAGDTLTITNDAPNVDQNLFATVSGDAGSTTADNTTDTLTIAGGASISTSVVGDTLTITNDSPNIVQNLFETFTADAGSTSADTATDTLTISGGTGISTSIVGDTLTIVNDAPNVDQNLFETFTADTGSTTADTTTDTLTISGGTGISTDITGDVLTINSTQTVDDLASITVGLTSSIAIPTTFTNVTWDVTHVENNDAVIERDGANPDRILIKETGLYQIAFSMSFDADAGEETIESRVIIDDTTVIPGSLRRASEDDEINDLSNVITAELTAGTYITFQTQASGAGNLVDDTTTFSVIRLQGIAGAQGEQGAPGIGSTIAVEEDGVSIGVPVDTLNFIGASVTAVAGSPTSRAEITITGGGGTPAPPVQSVQYNDGGSFGGDAQFVFDPTASAGGTSGRVTIVGNEPVSTQLAVGGVEQITGSPPQTQAPVYVEVNSAGEGVDGIRVFFNRNTPDINGWIGFDYDGAAPNFALVDEDDDPPYITFNVLGSPQFAGSPLGSASIGNFRNRFGGRNVPAGGIAGAVTGFEWQVNDVPIATMDGNFFQVPGALDTSGPTLPADVAGSPAAQGYIRYNLIGGQPHLMIADHTRAKVLSVETATYIYSEAAVGNNDWIEVGRASDADVGFIMPFDGTIVGVQAFCENDNGVAKGINLYINAALNSSLGSFPGTGTNVSFSDNTIDVDVTAGDRIRLRGENAGGVIQDTVITLRIKWRAT